MAEEVKVRRPVRWDEGDYRKDEFYCPGCGAQAVWCETDPGDYYEGPVHYCLACGAGFTLPTFREAGEYARQDQIVAQLRQITSQEESDET